MKTSARGELFRGKEISRRATDLALLGRDGDDSTRTDELAENAVARQLVATTQPKPGMTQQQLSRIVHSLEDKCNARIQRILMRLEEESKFRGKFEDAHKKAAELTHRNEVLYKQLQDYKRKYETERAKKDPRIIPKKGDWIDTKLVGLMQNHLNEMMADEDDEDTTEIRQMEGQLVTQKGTIKNLKKKLKEAKEEIKRMKDQDTAKRKRMLERKEKFRSSKKAGEINTTRITGTSTFHNSGNISPSPSGTLTRGLELWVLVKGRLKDVIKLGEKWLKEEIKVKNLTRQLPIEYREENSQVEAKAADQQDEDMKHEELVSEVLRRAEGSQEAMRRRPTLIIPGNPALSALNNAIKSKTLRKRLSPLATSSMFHTKDGQLYGSGHSLSNRNMRGSATSPGYLSRVTSATRRRKLSALPNSKKKPLTRKKKFFANPAVQDRPNEVQTVTSNARVMSGVVKLLKAYDTPSNKAKLSKEKLALALTRADEVITQLGSRVTELEKKMEESRESMRVQERESRVLFDHARKSEEKLVRLANENLQLLKAGRYLESRLNFMKREQNKKSDYHVEGEEYARLQLHYERGRQLVADMFELISQLQNLHYNGNRLREGKGVDPSEAEMLIRKNHRKFNTVFRKGQSALESFGDSCVEDLQWLERSRKPILEATSGSMSARGPPRDAARELVKYEEARKKIELPIHVLQYFDLKPRKKKVGRKREKKLLERLTRPTASYTKRRETHRQERLQRTLTLKAKTLTRKGLGSTSNNGRNHLKQHRKDLNIKIPSSMFHLVKSINYCPVTMGAEHKFNPDRNECVQCGMSVEATATEVVLGEPSETSGPARSKQRENSLFESPGLQTYLNKVPYCPASMGAAHEFDVQSVCSRCGARKPLSDGE